MSRISRKATIMEGALISVRWNAGIYLRLSEKDEGDKDKSNSIENQQELLVDYIGKSTEIKQIDVYIDDGKTGTNFSRPGFQRLLEDIKKKRINCVIVKDLSRMGRNLYEMGAVLETIFPLYGVRFIAVTDHFDSENTNAAEMGYIVPIKNLLNASYIADLSKKSKSARKVMQEKGKYIGAYAIFGYQKSQEDKHCLIVDPVAAEVVQLIFNLAEQGISINSIVKYLNEQRIDPPAQYRKKKESKEGCFREKNVWYNGTVRHILYSLIYTGALVQGRMTVLTPKGKKVKKSKEDWVIVENTHEPIIEKERFERVHKVIEIRKEQYAKSHSKTKNSPNILQGKLYCGACKKAIRRHRSNNGNKFVYEFLCPDYSSNGGCSKNWITENKLLDILLDVIKKQIELAGNCEYFLNPTIKQGNLQSESNELQIKLNQTVFLKGNIYQDYKKGILNKEDYLSLKEKYVKQDHKIKEQILALRTKAELNEDSKKEFSQPVSYLLNNSEEKELSRKLLETFVERIEISDGSKVHIQFRYYNMWKEWKAYIQSHCKENEFVGD